MNNDEAKKVLSLYRPGTADRTDPAFSEALQRAKPSAAPAGGQEKSDPELGGWFQKHCASYLSIRSKFLKVPVPPGLEGRILAGYKPPAASVIPLRPAVFLAAAAVLVLCVGLAALFWRAHGREDDFDTYRNRMARTASRPYGIQWHSRDLQSINAFLAKRKAPADYVLPDGVLKAQAVGCTVLQWQGGPVSMICFHSGRPLPPGEKTDLWLFIVDQSSVRDGPAAARPIVTRAVNLMTASWSRDGKTYVLAAAGDEEFLRKYL